MNTIKTSQYKAFFLLFVFSLSTVVGFACAAGVDMGFNNHHHEENSSSILSHHGDLSHHEEDYRHHQQTDHHHGDKIPSEKGGCCTNSVIEFQKLDTNTSLSSLVFFTPVFVACIYHYNRINITGIEAIASQRPIMRHYYPPPRDIRVSIQSFQI